MDFLVLSFLVFAPLLGLPIILLIPKNKTLTIKLVGILATLPTLATVIYIYISHLSGGGLSRFSFTTDWFHFGSGTDVIGRLFSVDYQMNVDSLSMMLIVLTAGISTFAAMASSKIQQEIKGYFSLFLILETGMLGVFAAGNMILFFLFFEMTLISAFFLIGKWGFEKKERAAYQFLIYNGIGSAILLIVIMTIQAKTGTTDIKELIHNLPINNLDYNIQLSNSLKMGLLVAIVLAFLIKLPSFPFHSWMLKTHTQAPIPIVMIHSAILLKIGAYGLIRFGLAMFPEQFKTLAPYIALLGVFNLLYGAFLAYIQTDIKRLLAYSSISHMGFILMGLGALNEIGIQGAIFQMVSHGVIAALLFFLVGVLYQQVHTTDINKFSGLSKEMPIFSAMFLLGSMAMLGLPGLSGFASEVMAFIGLFQTHRVIAALSTIGMVLTAVYALAMAMKISFGEFKLPKKIEAVRDLKGVEIIPAVMLAVFIVVLGVMPNILGNELQYFIDGLIQGVWG